MLLERIRPDIGFMTIRAEACCHQLLDLLPIVGENGCADLGLFLPQIPSPRFNTSGISVEKL